MCCSCGDFFLALIAILFPPIAVWIKCGICTPDSIINILLCVLGYLPGLIHAWYIIARHPEPDRDYEVIDDAERGGQRVSYYYISRSRSNNGQRQYGTQGQQPKPIAAPQSGPPPDATVAGPSVGAGTGAGAPPSYSDVVKGDNKIQSQD